MPYGENTTQVQMKPEPTNLSLPSQNRRWILFGWPVAEVAVGESSNASAMHSEQSSQKIVIGFSDGTSILNALAQHLGWITFHGPVITALSDPDVDDELDDCLAILRGQKSTIGFESNSIERMEGRLFGGNLTVLASSIGQQYGLRHSPDALWLLEDVGEAPYRLERAFCQLKNAGIFKSAKGLLLGDLDLPLLQSERITDGFAHDSELPVISQIPAGHRGRNACLPIGARLYADGGLGTVTALEPWVISR